MKKVFALLMVAIFGVASAQEVSTTNFEPAAYTHSVTKFSCANATGKDVEISASYGLRRSPSGVFEGKLDGLEFKSKAIAATDLARINKKIAGGNIEGIAASCHVDGSIRLVARVWNRKGNGGTGAASWVTITRNKSGRLDVR